MSALTLGWYKYKNRLGITGNHHFSDGAEKSACNIVKAEYLLEKVDTPPMSFCCYACLRRLKQSKVKVKNG